MGIELFYKQSEQWTFSPIETANTQTRTPSGPIAANRAYVSVILRSMWIEKSMKNFTAYSAAVHSQIAVDHPSAAEGRFEVNTVVSPQSFRKLAPNAGEGLVQFGHRLFGPVPYRGGDLRIQIGLVSVKESDMTAAYLDLLGAVANAAGVEFSKIVAPFLQPLRKGVELLFSSHDALEVGVDATQQSPVTGHFVVMRAPKGSVAPSSLRIDNDWSLVDKTGRPFRGAPYFVFSIEAATVRANWHAIPELRDGYAAIQKALRSAKQSTEVPEALHAFRITTLTCPDLLFSHAQAVVAEVNSEVDAVLPKLQQTSSATGTLEMRPLDALQPSFDDP